MQQDPETPIDQPAADVAVASPEAEAPTINADRLNDLMTRLKARENIVMGGIAGLVAALVGAGIWAAITVATNFQIGWMAIGVGFLCGYAVRFMGKGVSDHFGYVGAACALFGCLLGNFFSIVGFIAKEFSVGFFEVLTQMDYALLPEIMGETFSPIDLLFYGFALYAGYKNSFHQLTEADMQAVVD